MRLSRVAVGTVRFVSHDPCHIRIRQHCCHSSRFRHCDISDRHGRCNSSQLLVRILHVDLTAVITADSCHIATSSDLHILDHISLIPLYISLGIRTVSAVFTICKNTVFQPYVCGIR